MSKNEPAVLMCECGENPRLSMYVEVCGRFVYTKWCASCAAKQIPIDRRTRRKEKASRMRKRLDIVLPEKFRHAHIAHTNAELLRVVKSKKPGQGYYFWGDVGRGKTYLAAAIMRFFIIRGKQIQRRRFSTIADEINETYQIPGKSKKLIIDRYCNVDLLCIEDLGSKKNRKPHTDADIDNLLEIIDRRDEGQKPTLITSNLSLESLCETFDTRINSRLQTFLIIEMTGRDRRKE